jgi:predicted helicase
MEIIAKIEKKLGMKLVVLSPDSSSGTQAHESGLGKDEFSPEDLLDYIYAVLHSKTYRENYKEFLKIDFPRVPFDVSKTVFRNMLELGRELRSWHLLENEKLTSNNFITSYPEN